MSADTALQARYSAYLQQLAVAIAHQDRIEPMIAYISGLTLPAERKSVEPIAARIDPLHVSAWHQSLLHFVGQAAWDDHKVLSIARDYALSQMRTHGPVRHWVIDDTGFPKKGKHSVGVANQYCGILGKNANSQVTVTVSITTDIGSIPAAYRLYLPEKWAADPARRKAAGVPEKVFFVPKWKLALALIDQVRADKMTPAPVLADAGFGDVTDFREGLTDRNLVYTVGLSHTTTLWPPGQEPLPPAPWSGRGRRPKNLRHSEEHKPVTAKQLAQSLPPEQWHTVTWRDGTGGPMTSRFCRLKVRPAHRDTQRTQPWPEQWLLIEWPQDEAEPTKYWFSTEDLPFIDHIRSAKGRWRIERDYQELKTEFGLDKYQGRGWRGFHHHWTLCIAAYAFTIAERARLSPPLSLTPSIESKSLPYPTVTESGELPPRSERHQPTSVTTLTILLAQMILRLLSCCPYCRRFNIRPLTQSHSRSLAPPRYRQPPSIAPNS